MDRTAVFVDAGYLFAQGSVALSGQKLPRGGSVLDPGKAVEAFAALAEKVSGLPLLRIYWYDGTSTGPTSQHLALAHHSNIKLRLGFVNSFGEQKGVDSLVVTDMINLARNRAMSDAVLLSGDEDIRVGVQQAQELGVRVHLVGIKPSRRSQSLFLLQEADTTHEWGETDLSPFLSLKQQPEVATQQDAAATQEPPSASPAQVPSTALREVAELVASTIPPPELAGLVAAIRQTKQTPREVDALLLAKSRSRLTSNLDSRQKAEIRRLFLESCEQRLGAAS